MNRKALLLLFVVLTLAVSSIFATESRMTALGNPFGFIRDNTDISYYPGVINMYERNLRAELGTTSFDWKLGANLPLMNNILGVYLNEDTGINVDSYFTNGVNYYNTGDLNISKKIQFYYGFMEKFGVGFGMAIDSKVEDYTDNPDEQAEMGANYFEITGGMSDDKMDLGLGLGFWGASDSNTDPSNKDENTLGGFGFSANGRYFVVENDNFDFVAAANLMFTGSSMENKDVISSSNTTTTNEDYGTLYFDLGIGLNYKFDENNKLLFTVKPLTITSESYTGKTSAAPGDYEAGEAWLVVPTYTIGLESQIKPWLTGRVGGSQSYTFYADVDDPDGTSIDEDADYRSSFNADLGLAMEFGNFTIDTVLSKSLLHQGPDFIGGGSPGFASMVSVNYNY